MTIIRNKTELARHLATYEDVNGERNPKLAEDAKRRAHALLAKWRSTPLSERTAFNDIFGPPPTS